MNFNLFWFFFSSRRRHTRWTGDWSSDVCSSDLACEDPPGQDRHLILVGQEPLAGVHDALRVVADLERDDRADVERDALPCHTGLAYLGLAHGQRQEAGLAEEGDNERA